MCDEVLSIGISERWNASTRTVLILKKSGNGASPVICVINDPAYGASVMEIPAKRPWAGKKWLNYTESGTHAYQMINSKVVSANSSHAEIIVARFLGWRNKDKSIKRTFWGIK